MIVLSWGLAATAAAIIIHLVWWRISLPARQTKALLAIFLLTILATVSLGACVSWLAPSWQPYCPVGLWQYLHMAEVVLALALAYIVTYSALEADSPSLVLALAIHAKGDQGLALGDMGRIMDDDHLIRPRVEDLLMDKMATYQGDHLVLTRKGKNLAWLFTFYRRLLNKGMGG